jgi:hypothetical protein
MSKLREIHNERLNGFMLHLGTLKQLHRSGWKGFELYLKHGDHGDLSTLPVVKGIYSVGGKDGIKPWMDIEYREEIEFPDGDSFSLSSKGLNRKLFKRLGDIIPLGGHLMVSYEENQKIHVNTRRSLSIGIPPMITPLGIVIFFAGFEYVKDWYLAEGGHEGPQKLWGEKAPDPVWANVFYEQTAQQILAFLDKMTDLGNRELIEPAKELANEVLALIKK